MALAKFDGLELPASADFHVHLRDGDVMEIVVPTIRMYILFYPYLIMFSSGCINYESNSGGLPPDCSNTVRMFCFSNSLHRIA